MTTQAPTRPPPPLPRRPGRAGWWLPLPLLLLSVIPITFGTLRLIEIFGGPMTMPANPRIARAPSPAVIHIVGGGLFLVVGAFQFSRQIRRRWRPWHRRAGRGLIALGVASALAASWMTLLYPRQTDTGTTLYLFRLALAPAMAAALVLGFRAIRRQDVARHRAWMIRAYALGLGAGTQAFTIGFGEGMFGKSEVTTDLSTASGWIINIALGEAVIRRRRTRRRSPER